jgi:hypothetical protein
MLFNERMVLKPRLQFRQAIESSGSLVAAIPPTPRANQTPVTNPQWIGAAKNSSRNQKVCPHSLNPTLTKIMKGPMTANVNGSEMPLA